MAAPPKSKRLTKEEFPDAPEWFEIFLGIMGAFMTSVTNALTRRLTLEENMLSQVEKKVPFTSAADALTAGHVLTFKNKMGAQINHVRVSQLEPVDTTLVDPWSVTWAAKSTGEIEVMFQGLANSTKYRVSVVFEA